MVGFLGPLIGGGVSLVSAIMNANAQKQANNINWSALQETKRQNRRNERLATADRADPYGNIIKYLEGVGFKYDLTPITQAILAAEQRERKANLEEDAPRNRAAAVRMDDRSKLADDEFEKRFNEFKYGSEPNRDAYVADATDDLLRSRRKGLDQASALLARQLIRTGGGSQIASVFKQADDAYAGSLDEVISKAGDLGEQR